jgi:SAM-dependent methyltransferase
MGVMRRGLEVLAHDIRRAEFVLTVVFYLRLVYFLRIRKSLKTQGSDSAFDTTLMHNLKSLGRRLNRMRLLIEPLSVVESVDKRSRILVIGPRNEWDLLLLVRSGFDFKRCVGLDLISYAPSIKLGDMHAMPFADQEFDVVLCGWTLSYSAEPQRACSEIARVCRPGGAVGVAVEYFCGDAAAEKVATGGYLIQDERLSTRINSVAQIIAMFPGAGEIYFSHDAPLKRSVPYDALPSNCAVVFRNG